MRNGLEFEEARSRSSARASSRTSSSTGVMKGTGSRRGNDRGGSDYRVFWDLIDDFRALLMVERGVEDASDARKESLNTSLHRRSPSSHDSHVKTRVHKRTRQLSTLNTHGSLSGNALGQAGQHEASPTSRSMTFIGLIPVSIAIERRELRSVCDLSHSSTSSTRRCIC